MAGVAFVKRDGCRVTPFMNYQLERLNKDFKAKFGLLIKVRSAIRLKQEQIDIFLDRYVVASEIRGRRVYDTRVWNGVRYYRISREGTVAVPGYSNHEIQGSKAAVDLYDTGSDAGITSKNSVRGRWLRANAYKYGLIASGDGFGEGWHFDMINIYNAVPGIPAGGGTTAPPKEAKVTFIHTEDATARDTKRGGRALAPGSSFWLNKINGASTAQATNITGPAGHYDFSIHVYADGVPGDSIDIQLYWDNTKTAGPHSGHYVEHIVFPADGKIRKNFPFDRPVVKGYAVYANMRTPATNKGTVKVTVFDADATA